MSRFILRGLLAALPTLMLAVAVMQSVVGGAEFAMGERELVLALFVAGVAPLAAMAGLRSIAPDHDLALVAIAGALTAIGMGTLYQLASSGGPDERFYVSIATRHGVFVGLGFTAMMVGALAARRSEVALSYPYTILGVAFVLTAVTIAFGETVNGARLWLQIGPARFQPSELARLLIVLFVAVFLHERRHLVATPWTVRGVDLPPIPYLVPMAGGIAGATALLVFQNDLGMAALVILGASVSVAGVVRSKIALCAVGLSLSAGMVVAFLTVPRVRDRIIGWLEPWRDPAGRGFQFIQADYSLANGKMLGEGTVPAAGNVPELHTDFILVGVGGHLGWLVAVGVLALAALMVCRCFLAALRAPTGFTSLLVLSFSALIGIQLILIAGGSLRLLPLTGLTFPLLSYGGTSMIATLFGLGVVAGIGAVPTSRL